MAPTDTSGGTTPHASRRAVRHGILRRTIAALAAAMAIFVGAALVAYRSAVDYARAMDESDVETALQHALDDVVALVVDEETAQRGFALSGDPVLLEPYEASVERLPGALQRLEVALDAAGESARWPPLRDAALERRAFGERAIADFRAGRTEEVRARMASDGGRRLTERVRVLAEELEQRRAERRHEARARAGDARSRTGLALVAAFAVTLVLGLFAIVAVRRDLHALERAARALEDGERRFRSIAETSSDLVRLHGRDFSVLYASPSSLELLGYTPDEMLALGRGALDAGPDDAERFERIVGEALDRMEAPPPLVHRCRTKDGAIRFFETRVEPIVDGDGSIRRFQSASRDVTDRVERERELEEEASALRTQSTEDELTGLLNRRGLNARAHALLRTAREAGSPVAVFFCDLDGLKAINDELGHAEGDRAIRDAAAILREVARTTDLVARIGGDELVVVGMAGKGSDPLEGFRARIEARIARHGEEEKRKYRLAMSIGSATWPSDGSRSLDAVLAEADAAMYRVKTTRRPPPAGAPR
jgi:diguanylate cyclase (GGDEF)-like protein/PAS domain S-box-containing protein